MENWFLDNLGKILIVLIVIAFMGSCAAFEKERKDRETFMAQCLKDRKEYECVAMWRAGENKTTYIPVVVPIR